MKHYKSVFFDWDGTAVLSRKASPDQVIQGMKLLLNRGIKLVIVSGTTYDNIAGGRLHTYFTPEELDSLFLGLGRGAFNYRFDENGRPYVWKHRIPAMTELLAIHDVCYDVHRYLLKNYGFPTDIVFTRPNYCKIDLMVENIRGDQLFLQAKELDVLKVNLEAHGFTGGLKGLVVLADQMAGDHGVKLSATTDAKYLEIGASSKSDNVDVIMEYLEEQYGITAGTCAFWGDEYVGLDEELYGSDSYMMTEKTKAGDFFDVSDVEGKRPDGVNVLGGGVKRFLEFLEHC